jgi:hypothetical protein
MSRISSAIEWKGVFEIVGMDRPKLDGSMQHFISAVVHNALKLITAVSFADDVALRPPSVSNCRSY